MGSPKAISKLFEIRYKNSLSPVELLVGFDVFKSITGKEPQIPNNSNNQPTGGFEFADQSLGLKMVVESNRIAILAEIEDTDVALKLIKKSLSNIYSKFSYQELEVSRIGFRTMWVTEYRDSFTQLLNTYKSKIYSSNSLVNESSDVAIVLTFDDGDYKVNFSSGPMKPDQLKQTYLVFKDKKGLPHDFVFLDIDRYSVKVDNDLRRIKSYIGKSLKYEINKANELNKILF